MIVPDIPQGKTYNRITAGRKREISLFSGSNLDKFRIFDPVRADGRNAYAVFQQLYTQSPAVGIEKSLGGSVGVKTRNRLKSSHGTNLSDAASGTHIRNQKIRHIDSGLVIHIYHSSLFCVADFR